ncbi:glycosyltransferase family 39 protein [Dictyobacter vulcani]|nr:glycosyltransferase family 39 protein [Dictyobacter vulcani]
MLAVQRTRHRLANFTLWLCLLLACTGASWFAFQYTLIPQQQTYVPQWHGAHWIEPADASAPVAYYHYMTNFNTVPDNAFVLITANQVFRLFANGIFIGANTQDFDHGEAPRSYMFDLDSVLQAGVNAFSIRVVDADQKHPQLRASIGLSWGGQTHYIGSDASWQATGRTMLAHARGAPKPYSWTLNTFDTTSWQPAHLVSRPQYTDALLTVDPIVYTHPLPSHWLSAEGGQEGYFVRQLDVPEQTGGILLRLIATGQANVFINGHQYMQWDGQPPVPQQTLTTILDAADDEPVVYRTGLITGVYDITPYLHKGHNTLAIHVLAPGNSTAKVGLDPLKNAIAVDVLTQTGSTVSNLTAQDTKWRVSTQAVPNWISGGSTVAQWSNPSPIGRPGASMSYYLPDNSTPRNVISLPPILVAKAIIYSSLAILAFWLLLALLVLQPYYPSRKAAFEAASLVFLPALALEALLIVLAREPLLPQPFPYTTVWGCILLALVGASALGLWLNARYRQQRTPITETQPTNVGDDHMQQPVVTSTLAVARPPHSWQRQQLLVWRQQLFAWLRQNWGLIPIMALIIPMSIYSIGYEPFWQDELSSYNAARNIMLHGFPAFPSGFIYPKGELYSYLLAAFMFIFGTTGQVVPRIVSLIEYLVSIPLLYIFTQRLFNRKIAWLAAAMLAFSPYALNWSRQTRMYEQAQFMVIVVVYMLYRAIEQREKKRPVYLAIACLVLAYLSHEENFIILPAALICTLLATREAPYGMPYILRKKHWWIPALTACALIIIQLLAVFWTHPPTFATDQSRRPQIQPGFDNVPYYFSLLFKQIAIKDNAAPWLLTQPWLIINSLLAVLGIVLAFIHKDRRPRFYALFLVIASVTLIMVFTMQADRYYYPLLPIYYILGAYAFWNVLSLLWRFARPHLVLNTFSGNGRRPDVSLPIRITLGTIIAILAFSVLVFPALPLSNYNLLVSRTLGLSYRHHFADYDNVSNYMKGHLKKGDTVVTIAPAVSVLYYVGQADYYFSIDRALFLIEQNGKIVETTSGSSPLLNPKDFQNVLATHNRVWLITDNGGYQGGVTKLGRFTFPPADFRMVYEGYGSAVYFRGSDG